MFTYFHIFMFTYFHVFMLRNQNLNPFGSILLFIHYSTLHRRRIKTEETLKGHRRFLGDRIYSLPCYVAVLHYDNFEEYIDEFIFSSNHPWCNISYYSFYPSAFILLLCYVGNKILFCMS